MNLRKIKRIDQTILKFKNEVSRSEFIYARFGYTSKYKYIVSNKISKNVFYSIVFDR